MRHLFLLALTNSGCHISYYKTYQWSCIFLRVTACTLLVNIWELKKKCKKILHWDKLACYKIYIFFLYIIRCFSRKLNLFTFPQSHWSSGAAVLFFKPQHCSTAAAQWFSSSFPYYHPVNTVSPPIPPTPSLLCYWFCINNTEQAQCFLLMVAFHMQCEFSLITQQIKMSVNWHDI